MKRIAALALALAAVVAPAAHADVLSERVVLGLDLSTPCRGGRGVQLRVVALGANGTTSDLPFGQGGARNFVVPKGYALEITDLEYNVWEPFPTYGEIVFQEFDFIKLMAENLSSAQQSLLANEQIRRRWHVWADHDSEEVFRTDMFEKQDGTHRISFVSGLLVSDKARVCVEVGSNLLPNISGDSFRLRGRLHKLDGTASNVDDAGTGLLQMTTVKQ